MRLGEITSSEVGSTGGGIDSQLSAFIQPFVNVLESVTSMQTRLELEKINLERARMGSPPLSLADYQTGFRVTVDPGLQTLGQIAVFGLLGLGMLALLRR